MHAAQEDRDTPSADALGGSGMDGAASCGGGCTGKRYLYRRIQGDARLKLLEGALPRASVLTLVAEQYVSCIVDIVEGVTGRVSWVLRL